MELANFLESYCKAPNCKVVHDNKLSFFPAHVYNTSIPSTFIMDVPGSHNDSLALATQKSIGILAAVDAIHAANAAPEIWFVTQEKAIAEARSMGLENVPNLTVLEGDYDVINTYQLGDLVIFRMLR
jgi:hypothetical protein